MTQNVADSISAGTSKNVPGHVFVVGDFHVDQADSVIARIREVAAEILAERDAEVLSVISKALDWSDTELSDCAAHSFRESIQSAGYEIVKKDEVAS